MNTNVTLPPPVVKYSGVELAHQLPYLSAGARRLLACKLAAGEAVLDKPTRSQAALLLGVSASSVAAIARSRGSRATRPNKPMSDAAVQRLVARIGPQRIFDALDRATAPVAAE
jgi:hypothetical protein